MGWLASLLTLIGLLLNARKVRASWFVWMIGNVLWMIHGAYYTHDNAIVVLNFVFLFVNYFGFFSWRPDAPAKLQIEDHSLTDLTDLTFQCAEIIASLKARRDTERRKDAAREAADRYVPRVYCGRKDCFPFDHRD